MKKTMLFAMIFLAGMATTAILGWRNNAERTSNPESRPIIVFWDVKLKPGITAAAFEAWAPKVANNEYGKIPGAKIYLAKGERGGRIGDYLLVLEWDSKQSRDFYYPVPGADATKRSAEATKLLQPWDKIATEFGKMAEVVNTGKEHTDYIMLE